MRWVSNKESVREGEPSVLAIAETLIAMGLALWIAVHFGTVKHVVIGACIAPFLLLQTDESAVLGIRACQRILGRLFDLFGQSPLPKLILLLLMLVPIRVFAIIATVVRSPVAGIRAILRNWWRIAVATDFCRSPQFLPLPNDSAVVKRLAVVVDAGDIYPLFSLTLGTKIRPIGIQGWNRYFLAWSSKWLLILPIVGLPAILYRWSLKSTAIIWFPLLWATTSAS